MLSLKTKSFYSCVIFFSTAFSMTTRNRSYKRRTHRNKRGGGNDAESPSTASSTAQTTSSTSPTETPETVDSSMTPMPESELRDTTGDTVLDSPESKSDMKTAEDMDSPASETSTPSTASTDVDPSLVDEVAALSDRVTKIETALGGLGSLTQSAKPVKGGRSRRRKLKRTRS